MYEEVFVYNILYLITEVGTNTTLDLVKELQAIETHSKSVHTDTFKLLKRLAKAVVDNTKKIAEIGKVDVKKISGNFIIQNVFINRYFNYMPQPSI